MRITVGFSEDRLFGPVGAEGYSPSASADTFADMVMACLADEYSEAEITVQLGSNDFHWVKVEDEEEDESLLAKRVGDVIHKVWAGCYWLVEEPEGYDDD